MAEFATADGHLYYELIDKTADEGVDHSSPPATVTLLHNIMSTGEMAWGRMVPTLAKQYRVLLPDLPGHGRSSPLTGPIDYQVMAEKVAGLMAAVGATEGHLLGCSAGGMIAQHLVHEGWVTPASLTLISTTYSTNATVTAGAQSLDPDNFQFGKRWLEATAKLHDRHHYEGYYADVILPSYRAMTVADALDLSLETLRDWHMAACIIHGEDDEFFPVRIAEEMAAALPNARLHIVPGESHALIFRQARQVLTLIEAFLQELR